MYLPDNCDHSFTLPSGSEGLQSVVGNRERTIFAVVTDRTLYFYLAHPQLLLCTFKRDDEEVEQRGEYRRLFWRHNSTSICVTTSKQCVYVYTLEISQNSECFNLHDPDGDSFIRTSPEFYLRQKRPVVNVYLSVVAKLESVATCVTSLKDEIFVCLEDGWVHRLSWSGEVLQNFSFNVRQVPFSIDQVTSKSDFLTRSSAYIADFVYCPLIGGICIVLSDGRAALLVSASHLFQPNSITGVWIVGLKDAVCCAANHKFRLVYFGCRNGEIAGYTLDATNGSLAQVFRIRLFVKNGTEYLERISAVRQLHCLSQGGVFAVIWDRKKQSAPSPQNSAYSNGYSSSTENTTAAINGSLSTETLTPTLSCPPALAIFSPFGAQWWSSFEDADVGGASHEEYYRCMDWGSEGFQLWIGSSRGLLLMNLAHSANVSLERVVMIGSDRIYLSPLRNHEKHAMAPHIVWETLKIPYEYIGGNWPIRLVGIDNECTKALAVAGTRGLCFYNFRTAKWRLFRKEAQEKALFLLGGVAVFDDFILAAGCDTDSGSDNIFAFHLDDQLDTDMALKLSVSRVLMMSSRDNILLTFDEQSVVSIFALETVPQPKSQRPKLKIERMAEIGVEGLLPHPTCLISMQLTTLNYHSDVADFCFGLDSLLINVSGHLLMLSPVHKQNPSTPDGDENQFPLHPPMLIASNVERVWMHSSHRNIPHLKKALWINAGFRKMKVWLPLSHANTSDSSLSSKRTFISKRIMLPVELNFCPLAIDEDCLACGAQCLANSSGADRSTTEAGPIPSVAVHSLSRTSEVFVHRLLKQLLKRNLGSHALEIAAACRQLPYFSHILELLLHDVLDEEATSSEPIPDPLLPSVVAFIHEFPEYLQTIVHCARKTELAFWNLLFSVSHHPRELFKMCLEAGELDTAISCLIVLQSMENAAASAQYAATLLDEALTKRRWKVARDIVRFLRSIDRTDFEDVPESPLYQKLVPKSNKQICVLPDTNSDDYGLGFNSSGEGPLVAKTSSTKAPLTHQSSSGHSPNAPNATVSRNTSPLAAIAHRPSLIAASVASSTGPPIFYKLEEILNRHAESLLEDYAIRDLGAFASHLEFDLARFFGRPKNAFTSAPDDFPLILMKLHAQFSWPYPVGGHATRLDSSDMLNGNVSSNVDYASSVDDTASDTSRISGISFDWRVFEKLYEKSKVKGTEESEAELVFMLDWLAKCDCLEWIFFLCLLRQDVYFLNQQLLKHVDNINKLCAFFVTVKKGMECLVHWALGSCPPYVAILQFFRHFLEIASDPNHLRKLSQSAAASAQKKLDREAEVEAAIAAAATQLNGLGTQRKKLELKVRNGTAHSPTDIDSAQSTVGSSP
ncbi:Protein R06F6.8 a [Aphelenchoides avenae]|nr:Protein R06F6.8 a [Aphelenchus avenae]